MHIDSKYQTAHFITTVNYLKKHSYSLEMLRRKLIAQFNSKDINMLHATAIFRNFFVEANY